MSDLVPAPADARADAAAPAPVAPSASAGTAASDGRVLSAALGAVRWWLLAPLVAAALIVAAGALAWRADRRVAHLEKELVQRQQESTEQSTEARLLAKQADESARADAARVALLDARMSEVTQQRGQLEDMVQSLSRSRDENLLVDVEAAIRLGTQQASITGSAEPLVAALKQSDERLARFEQPRVDALRRAIARDLDRVKAASVADIPSLSIKLDEAVRLVDELPLLAAAGGRKDAGRSMPAAAAAPASAASAELASGAGLWTELWPAALGDAWDRVTERVWNEAKSLVRVTRIDRPEAMLIAPEQAFFLRENLKLRLLNARLALLSRQFDTAQADLQAVRTGIDRYFDRNARRSVLLGDLLKQVAAQARQVGVPHPDDTLAALAATSAGR